MNETRSTGTKGRGGKVYDTEMQRWDAVRRRDGDAEGQFVYGVKTTGVYCRPGCPSRLAQRKNITFYKSGAEAERAGFRPCKRCKPEGASQRERDAKIAAKACRMIEDSDSPPGLDTLADAAGMSRFHFHRIFKEAIGLTPRQYGAAQRTGRVRSGLRGKGSVTEAIYGAGYNSSSRFYERAAETLGMTPRAFRGGGDGEAIRYSITACPLGLVLVAGTVHGICVVRFGNARAALERGLRGEFPKATIAKGDREFDGWVKWIVNQIEDPARKIDVPIDIRGTAFQQRVWQALREIPAGKTASYAQVAAKIGKAAAVRAVAGACGANPVAVIVPCHRVVRSDGGLGGYRWGLERKRELLKRETRT